MTELTVQQLIDRILRANTLELRQILDAVRERFSELYPNRELMTFCAPGSDPDRQIALLQDAVRLLTEMKR